MTHLKQYTGKVTILIAVIAVVTMWHLNSVMYQKLNDDKLLTELARD